MKNPDSRQASPGFKQASFLPEPDFTPESCPKFLKCNAPICPLDAAWRKRVLLSEDPTCFYLTESVKNDAETIFQGAGLNELYAALVRVSQLITARHPRIHRALERSKLTGFRMTRSLTKGIKAGGAHV
jgi:hypothetical protein